MWKNFNWFSIKLYAKWSTILYNNTVYKIERYAFLYTGDVCRCILGFYVSYPSKSTNICLLGFHLLLIAFPSHRRRSDIELCSLLANLRLREKSECDSKKCILRDTLHANFLQVSWSSPTNSKTARWSAFANTVCVTTSRAFNAFHA